MGQGLLNTKRRIQSISSTKKITKAMELVATVKLKKWKDKMSNVATYLDSMQEIISSCASGLQMDDTPELKKYKSATKTLYIVVTSSLGLCGGYNYNLFKFLNGVINKDDKVITIGTKALVHYSHEEVELDSYFVDIIDRINHAKVQELIDTIKDEYNTGNYKAVKLISTEYVNSLTFRPVMNQILPFENKALSEDNNASINEKKILKETIFEPSKGEVLALIIPKFLNTFLFGKLVEASVCEQAARRNAMDSATDNAEELLEKLRIEYNKARQSAITQEITEVVAGASNA